jgi:hypothetical protein
MKISITVEINETESVFKNLIDTEIFSIDVAYNKYKFDMLKEEQEKRLEYIATEISLQKRDVLVGNTCYNLHEVLYLNNELKKYNLNLSIVYIPSEERINYRIQQAIEEQRKWGYRDGVTDDEIVKNFANFRATLQEIRDGLKETSIEVKAV